LPALGKSQKRFRELREHISYAQHKISRTAHAQQRPQAIAQSQHQDPPHNLERKFAELLATGKKEEAAASLRLLSSAFDKAAKQGIVHRATADRKKSRLAIRLAKAK